MPVERVSLVFNLKNPPPRIPNYLRRYTPEIDKEEAWQAYLTDAYKITELPLDRPKVKQEEKPNTKRRLGSWLIVGGFILVYGLLNGWIGG